MESADEISLFKFICIIFAVFFILVFALFSLKNKGSTYFWIMIFTAAAVGYYILPSIGERYK